MEYWYSWQSLVQSFNFKYLSGAELETWIRNSNSDLYMHTYRGPFSPSFLRAVAKSNLIENGKRQIWRHTHTQRGNFCIFCTMYILQNGTHSLECTYKYKCNVNPFPYRCQDCPRTIFLERSVPWMMYPLDDVSPYYPSLTGGGGEKFLNLT